MEAMQLEGEVSNRSPDMAPLFLLMGFESRDCRGSQSQSLRRPQKDCPASLVVHCPYARLHLREPCVSDVACRCRRDVTPELLDRGDTADSSSIYGGTVRRTPAISLHQSVFGRGSRPYRVKEWKRVAVTGYCQCSGWSRLPGDLRFRLLDDALIELDVLQDNGFAVEPAHIRAAIFRIEDHRSWQGVGHSVYVRAEHSGHSFDDDLRSRAAAERDKRCAVGKRLDYGETERFLPGRRENQRAGFAIQIGALPPPISPTYSIKPECVSRRGLIFSSKYGRSGTVTRNAILSGIPARTATVIASTGPFSQWHRPTKAT